MQYEYDTHSQVARPIDRDSICRALDGNDYEVGQLEAAAQTAQNNSQAIAAIIMLLLEHLPESAAVALLESFPALYDVRAKGSGPLADG